MQIPQPLKNEEKEPILSGKKIENALKHLFKSLENKQKRIEMGRAALRFSAASAGATTKVMQLIKRYLA